MVWWIKIVLLGVRIEKLPVGGNATCPARDKKGWALMLLMLPLLLQLLQSASRDLSLLEGLVDYIVRRKVCQREVKNNHHSIL